MIRIRGARQHNLKNLSLEIPKEKLVVVTGPSGSGKSSLAFDTLFAEGQRRFVESLSMYARQFLDQLERPEVDEIEGLSPAIAIEQRSGSLNPRSTLATATGLYEYLRVLWAAIGVPHDPETGEPLEKMTPSDIVDSILAEPERTKIILLAGVPVEEVENAGQLLDNMRRQGFVRLRMNGEIYDLDEVEAHWPKRRPQVEIVVDRLVVREGVESRLADSIETALRIWSEEVQILLQTPDSDEWQERSFQTSYRNPKTGFTLGKLSPRSFSFNSHEGACRACGGLGTERFCEPSLLVANEGKPLAEAVSGWWKKKGRRANMWAAQAQALEQMFGVEGVAFEELPEELKQILFFGGEIRGEKAARRDFEGLCKEAERKLRAAKSEAVRRRILRAMAERACHACKGKRLRKEILAVKIEGKGWQEEGEEISAKLGIQDFCELSVENALRWIDNITLPDERYEVAKMLQEGVRDRLQFMEKVGLSYLGLDRRSGTLSGGEAQRIRLATQLGGGLSGVLYVLDEPSIGLHALDIRRLIDTLKELRDRGNSVIVVEHDEEMIRAADWMVELGPGAGTAGGQLLADGALSKIKDSPTLNWLKKTEKKESKKTAEKEQEAPTHYLRILGAKEHNLHNINVTIPLGKFTCLCGPSGSGKSTLADDILLRSLRRHFHGATDQPGAHDAIEGIAFLGKAIMVDQAPIGRSPRSNPATFTGVFDLIRSLFAKLPLSRQRGYNTGRFSFNTAGGRCERCLGAGRLKVEMHFLPDAWVPCTACLGSRYNRETLEIRYRGLSIADVLELSVSEAQEVFGAVPKVAHILQVIEELGLGYLSLGQASNTLSGGEAQRLKLALELARPAEKHTLYFFDEPTTGLGFADVERLIHALRKLVDAGHTVLVVEHHLEVIRAADWVIDMGPGGGKYGGRIVAEGKPHDIEQNPDSPTGQALRTKNH